MRDCPNGEIRDVLPEFVHDRLEPVEAARVRAHLATCETCEVEVALLRSLRDELRAPVAVNVDAISAAVIARTTAPAMAPVAAPLAAPLAAAASAPVAGRAPVAVWARARWLRAAVLLVAVGGASVVTWQRMGEGSGPGQPGMPKPTQALVPEGTTGTSELSFAGDVSDLGDTELAQLEAAIAALESQPIGDVETSAEWGSTTTQGGGR